VLFTTNVNSQSIGINGDGTTPDNNTMLDIKSTGSSSATYGLKVKDATGTANMVVRDDGNVGIGTVSPSEALDINGNLNLAYEKVIKANNVTVFNSRSWDAGLFIGDDAGKNSTTGGGTFIGYHAGYNNVSANANTFIGEAAGYVNTAPQNTFLGYIAGYANTLGTPNVFLGFAAGYKNTIGNRNVFIGPAGGKENVDGSDNICIGFDANRQNISGDKNTAVGTYAGYMNTGSSNTYLGHNAGGSIGLGQTTGSNCTFIGAHAGLSGTNNTNATAIGYRAVQPPSNTMTFGNTSVIGWGFGVAPAAANAIQVGTNGTNGNGARLTIGGVWTNASDRNKKENITEIRGEEIINKLEQLSITRWNYIGESPSITHIGPMAQDFSRLFDVGDDNKSISTIDPSGIALVAVKELINLNKEQQQTIQQLEGAVTQLQQKATKKEANYEARLQTLEEIIRLSER
ncbi:tail fiber domain-containing protein, partial [Flavobacteriales bacterium]|nr:tail fiber domain-containing protein [Flavobacteriales bacterium]